MNTKILNWEKIPNGSDYELLSIYYAFITIVNKIKKGVKIEDLKLKDGGGKDKVTDVGFREFLKSIVSVSWNDKEMTEEQIKAINDITEYLRQGGNQDPQPINGDSLTLEQLKEKYAKSGE